MHYETLPLREGQYVGGHLRFKQDQPFHESIYTTPRLERGHRFHGGTRAYMALDFEWIKPFRDFL